MDAFSYLSVLLSIILGLAITQVLQGVRGLLLARTHVRLYWPSLIWAGMILVIATQSWWASFGLADHQEWSFAAFGMVLVQTTLLYMLAALVLPDFPSGESHDLKAHYFREQKPFFGIAVAMLAASVTKDWVINGVVPLDVNLAFHGIYASLWTVALFSRSSRFHTALAVATLVIIAIYITILFARLH
jgi:hypothetical protein